MSSNDDRMLGVRVRTLRTELGVTCEGLAQRAGLHSSCLCALEEGKTAFSARIVRRIARALDVNLADLLWPAGRAPSPLNRRAAQHVWHDPQAGERARKLTADGYGDAVTLIELELPAGGVCDHIDPPSVGLELQVMVLEGRLNMTVAHGATSCDYVLDRGDCLHIGVGAGLVLSNPYDGSVRALFAIARV